MPTNPNTDGGAFVGGWLFHHEVCSVCHETTTILRFYTAGPPPAEPERLCQDCLPAHRLTRGIGTLRAWLKVRRAYHAATYELAQIAAVAAVQAAADAVQDAKLARLLAPVEARLNAKRIS